MEDSEGGKRVMTLMSDTNRPSEVGEKDERARHGFGSESSATSFLSPSARSFTATSGRWSS